MKASVSSSEKTAAVAIESDAAVVLDAARTEEGSLSDNNVATSRKKRPLLPILPQYEVPAGVLGVDREDTRVVYLAPLVSTSKEIYFAKHKELLKAVNVKGTAPGSNSGEEQGSDNGEADLDKHKVQAMVERQLARVRPFPRLASLNQQHSSSILDDPALGNRQRGSTTTIAGATAAAPEGGGGDGTTDVEIRRLKQKVHLLPISDDERSDFWETIRGYERMNAYHRRTSLASGISTPMGFNMEAAFNKMLLDQRHLLWTHAHQNRLELTQIRKEEEDESYKQRKLASSSENRARERLQRQMYEQLLCEAQNMQPIVMLSAFTQKMLGLLVQHWSRSHLEAHLRRIVRVWRDHRAIKRTNIRAATLLLEWLQKSVAVRTVAVRQLKFLLVQKLWIEYETEDVESAIEHHETKRIEAGQQTTQKKGGKSGSSQKAIRRVMRAAEQWMTFVPEPARAQVIHEFLFKVEREFVLQFRQQELEFFPQLVQTLRGEHPNRARSYIRAVAMRYALSGQVVENLMLFPGAVGEGVEIVKPFDVRQAPMAELLKQARELCDSSNSTV